MTAHSFSVGQAARCRWPPRQTLARAAVPCGPSLCGSSRRARAAVMALTSPRLRQKPLAFGPVLPPPPLQVPHARPRLALGPRRVEPPTVPLRFLQPERPPPPPRHGQQLPRGGPPHRVLGPRPALLPPPPLLQVAEAVLLPVAAAEALQPLRPV